MNGRPIVALSIFFKARNQFPLSAVSLLIMSIIYRNITDDKILNYPISEDEVRQSIKSLRNNKSPGPGDILNEMIFNGHNVLTPFLARVFQSIFERGSIPYECGKSIFIPTHKKGDINVRDTFRPISVTSLLSKVYTIYFKSKTCFVYRCLWLAPWI